MSEPRVQKKHNVHGADVLILKDRVPDAMSLADWIEEHLDDETIAPGHFLRRLRIEGRANGRTLNIVAVLEAYPEKEGGYLKHLRDLPEGNL